MPYFHVCWSLSLVYWCLTSHATIFQSYCKILIFCLTLFFASSWLWIYSQDFIFAIIHFLYCDTWEILAWTSFSRVIGLANLRENKVLANKKCFYSICDGTDVQVDWRSCSYGRARRGGAEVAGWTLDRKMWVQFPAYPHRVWALWWQGGKRHLRTSRCPCRGRLGTLKTPSCPWHGYPAAGQNLETGHLFRHYIAEISLNVTLNHKQQHPTVGLPTP